MSFDRPTFFNLVTLGSWTLLPWSCRHLLLILADSFWFSVLRINQSVLKKIGRVTVMYCTGTSCVMTTFFIWSGEGHNGLDQSHSAIHWWSMMTFGLSQSHLAIRRWSTTDIWACPLTRDAKMSSWETRTIFTILVLDHSTYSSGDSWVQLWCHQLCFRNAAGNFWDNLGRFCGLHITVHKKVCTSCDRTTFFILGNQHELCLRDAAGNYY